MTEETHAIEQSQLQRSAWHAFVVERARIDLPGDRNAEKIQGVIGELAQRLAALKEWDRYDRFNPLSVTLKEGYREVGRLDGHAGWVKSVQALSDGRIVSGDADSMACVWSPMPDGRWVCDVLPHNNPVRSVARMFDQRVVSGSADGIVRLWTHNGEHGWIAERVIARSSAVECLQTLPDGSIVTGYQDGSLTISKIVNKRWTHGLIATKSTVYALQGLPDGRIVTAHENGDVCWWRQSESGDLRRVLSPTTRFGLCRSFPMGASSWEAMIGSFESCPRTACESPASATMRAGCTVFKGVRMDALSPVERTARSRSGRLTDPVNGRGVSLVSMRVACTPFRYFLTVGLSPRAAITQFVSGTGLS